MSKPKVRRGWLPHPVYDAFSLLFNVDYIDSAAAVWLRKNGKQFWVAHHSKCSDERRCNIDHGECDTIEQAKAAAEAALRAAGYEFEGEGI